MTVPPAIFAIAVVLAAASDWELRVEGLDGPICAKSREVCETARDAIRSGRWALGVPRDVATGCVPHANCFSPESECIASYNCGPRR